MFVGVSLEELVIDQIDRVNLDMEAVERDYDLNRAAELKYETLISLQRQLEEAVNNLADYRKSGSSLLRRSNRS
ncbi:hypothetical protein FXO38_00848 [Capsicum annuum]|nr:hypothetical protein FXO38_00848 [Capsicum annuum]